MPKDRRQGVSDPGKVQAGRYALTPGRIALGYVIVGALWILVSDEAAVWLFGNGATENLAQTLKGLLFVVVTGLLLGALVTRLVREQRAAREEAQRLEERYRRLFRLSPAMNIVIGPGGEVLDVNTEVLRRMDFTPEDLIGRSVFDFVAPGQHEQIAGLLQRDFKGEVTPEAEVTVFARGGAPHRVLMSPGQVLLSVEEGGPAVVVTGVDITERREAEETLSEALKRLAFHVENTPLAVVEWDREFRVSRWSAQAENIFGWSAAEVMGKHPDEWRIVHKDDIGIVRDIIGRLMSGREPRNFCSNRNYTKSGEVIHCEWHNSVLLDEAGRSESILSLVLDVTERRRNEALAEGQARTLEKLATGDGLEDVLETLVLTVEAQAEGMLCSVLLLDDAGVRLYNGSAPNLPEEYTRAIEGLEIGPNVGSCGTAAFRRQRVIVEDIDTSPLWASVRDFVRPFGLRACWSQPIISSGDRVLGTFAMYYREPRAPSAYELGIIESAAHIAGIAIERRSAERRQAFMMQELDHRVKNNLAAVLSIAENSLIAAGSLEEFGKAFTGRVAALARVHALLASTRWEGISMRRLVSQTLEAYSRDDGGRVSAEGADITLPSRAGAPLCMALHELATNAVKYGSLSVPAGRVDVRWGTETSGAGLERSVHLTWVERDGPPPTTPTRRGFGSALIEDVIAYELSGKVSVRYLPSGVVCDIMFVLPPVVEGGAPDAPLP